MSRIVTGCGFVLGVQLTKDGQGFAIPPGATVKAAVVTARRDTVLAGPVEVDYAQPGSDWAGAVVVVKLTEAATGAIPHLGPALLEIGVTDPGGFKHPSWFIDVLIVKGNLT